MSVLAKLTATPGTAVLSTVAFNTMTILLLYVYFLFPPCKKLMSHAVFRVVMFSAIAVLSYTVVARSIRITFVGDSLTGLLCAVLLFSGPIVQELFSQYNWFRNCRMTVASYVKSLWQSNATFQTIKSVVIAPLGEEMLYRVFGCTVWETAGISKLKIIFLLPLMFGVSHLHFFLAKKNRRRQDLIVALVQVGFTTVFGWYAAFVWLRYHSFIGVALIHGFCNFMGFPSFDEALKWRYPVQKIFIGIAYLIGIIGFVSGVGYMATT